ncbi:MAG: antibiotic biosynthesis monooxygenase family protein [Desulfobaccales bacterium]
MANVVLINAFEIQKGREDECLKFWEKVAEFIKRQPGFISTKLHRTIIPGTRFPLINMAEWESVEHFEKAINQE